MYSIIIVEDDSMQRNILRQMILSAYKSIKIYEADSECDALDIIKKTDIDMFLIDIGLKDSSGLDLAVDIRRIPKYEFSQLIFLTTHVDYILQAFKQIHCYDYILKPYNKYEVQVMLNKLINKEIRDKKDGSSSEENDKELVIKIRSSIYVVVKICEVLFVEVKGRDCEINTVSGVYTYSNISLKKILELIDCDYIVQSHKSFAINKNCISKIENLGIRISNVYFKNYPKTALVGRKFRNNIISEFKQPGKCHVE